MIGARPYAKAAFEWASEQQALLRWSQLLDDLAALVTNDIIKQLLQDPHYSWQELADVLTNMIVGEKVNAAEHNFIKLLAKNHRLSLLPDIARLFAEQKSLAEKVQQVEVISAKQLTISEQQDLVKALSSQLAFKVELTYRLDPSLIGGLVMRIGDRVIDNSILNQLVRLKAILVR